MNTQFGLANLWSQGDIVIKCVAVLLLVMSLASWIVIALKTLDLLRYRKVSSHAKAFWCGKDFTAAINQLGADESNPYRQLALAGREATLHHQGTRSHLQGTLDISDWVTRALRNTADDFRSRLQSGLAVLASVGSTAPFVGLFGTVWGIYHALLAIGVAGNASIDKVAGPIGESLVMTALGLAVAIPAVLGYNALVRGNKSALHKMSRFAHDLHAYFVTGARVGGATHQSTGGERAGCVAAHQIRPA